MEIGLQSATVIGNGPWTSVERRASFKTRGLLCASAVSTALWLMFLATVQLI